MFSREFIFSLARVRSVLARVRFGLARVRFEKNSFNFFNVKIEARLWQHTTFNVFTVDVCVYSVYTLFNVLIKLRHLM